MAGLDASIAAGSDEAPVTNGGSKNERRSRSGKDAEDQRPSLIRRLVIAPTVLSFLWPALLLLLGYVAWHSWGVHHVGRQLYGIDPAAVQISPRPAYIRSEIVSTVFQDADLGSLSLLNPQATARVADAFAAHPWIRNVVGVRKLSNGHLDIRVDYRQPVGMVYVSSQEGETGFIAIDGESVCLPTQDFSTADAMEYAHIVVPGAYFTGTYGKPFGDDRVAASALLASLLRPHREKLEIVSIGVHGDRRTNPVVQLEVADAKGNRWFWGSSPGAEAPGENPPQMKLESLLSGAPPGSDLRITRIARK
ncbi:MAG: hypothetical protein AAGD07_18585 [Planctomycetota bacterium]